VHIAASLGTKSIVLFGPTDAHYYGYPPNLNIYFEGCNNCWLKTGNWITTCMLGDAVPRCMNSIGIEEVLAAVSATLGGLDQHNDIAKHQ
jgi:ADP-heptose:LPS heptosyltransferase